jgi:protein TonB
MSDRFNTAVLVSIIVHAGLIFGLTFKAANPALFQTDKPLEVSLVNARSEAKPLNPEVLAQYNLDGGGNVDEDRQAKSPLSSNETESPASSTNLNQRIKAQEEKVRKLLTQVKSTYAVPTEKPDKAPQPQPPSPPAPLDLSTDSVETARSAGTGIQLCPLCRGLAYQGRTDRQSELSRSRQARSHPWRPCADCERQV